MRAAGIVVVAPFGDQLAGTAKPTECSLVEAFIAHPPVEAPDKGVLYRLARLDGVPGDARRLVRDEDRGRSEFGAIIAADEMRLSPLGDDGIAFARYAGTRQRRGGQPHQGFARQVVDHRQDAEAPTASHWVPYFGLRCVWLLPVWKWIGLRARPCRIASANQEPLSAPCGTIRTGLVRQEDVRALLGLDRPLSNELRVLILDRRRLGKLKHSSFSILLCPAWKSVDDASEFCNIDYA